MKKLITIYFLIAITFASNAQDKKPTKEQTVAFIQDYFAERQSISRKTSSQSKISYQKMKISNNEFSFTFSWDYNETYFNMSDSSLNGSHITKEEVIFDFLNVESVIIRPYGNDNNNGQYHADLSLKAAPNTTFKQNGNNVKEVNIPVNSYNCSACNHFEYNKKILQAFNHLRKLCGAPKPINFED